MKNFRYQITKELNKKKKKTASYRQLTNSGQPWQSSTGRVGQTPTRSFLASVRFGKRQRRQRPPPRPRPHKTLRPAVVTHTWAFRIPLGPPPKRCRTSPDPFSLPDDASASILPIISISHVRSHTCLYCQR